MSRAGGALPLALATLAAGADTFFGPLYVAFGAAEPAQRMAHCRLADPDLPSGARNASLDHERMEDDEEIEILA